jgi:hypothetical protein
MPEANTPPRLRGRNQECGKKHATVDPPIYYTMKENTQEIFGALSKRPFLLWIVTIE